MCKFCADYTRYNRVIKWCSMCGFTHSYSSFIKYNPQITAWLSIVHIASNIIIMPSSVSWAFVICSPSATFVYLGSKEFVNSFTKEKESSLCLVDGWIVTRCVHVRELIVAVFNLFRLLYRMTGCPIILFQGHASPYNSKKKFFSLSKTRYFHLYHSFVAK